ncbi:hepatoma-derived growth factor-like [Contarinia nasturtii]|uniref:hepatoma-derived growth factor-like n=1 Tax=Contarinia nasturtii TaxID=265458 RepID=UPI0012D45FAB|nr:hepatoma-derived growth factor-like [Contarinia nasturtii]
MEEAVWAKLRYCPYWPAKIVNVPPGLKKQARKFYVYFFGTDNYAFVQMDNTVSYLQNKSKYEKKWRGQKFSEAIALCDEFIKNPNGSSLPAQKQILLAKEYEFEVKKEKTNEDLWYTNEVVNVQPTENCTDCVEKQTSIDSLKVENQQLETELRRMKDDSDNKSQKIYELETALKHTKDTHKIEIDEMNLKMQQFTSKRNDESTDDKRDEQFEVEGLLDHKIQNGKDMFFVKWKGFNNRHNSWVQRSNLNCEKILQQYLKSHKLK